MLLGSGKTLNGAGLADHQAVIAIGAILAVERIGGCEVVTIPLRIIGNAGISPLLDEGLQRLGIVGGAADGAADGILVSGSAGVHLLQVVDIPADGIGCGLAVGIGGLQLAHGLVQRSLGVATHCHRHFLGHGIDGGVIGIGELGRELVILRLGQIERRCPHRVGGSVLHGRKRKCRRGFRAGKVRQIRRSIGMYHAALILGIEKILLFGQIVDAAELCDAAQTRQCHLPLIGIVDEIIGSVEQDGAVAAAVAGHQAECAVSHAEQRRRGICLGAKSRIHDRLVLVEHRVAPIFRFGGDLHAAGLPLEAFGGKRGIIADIGRHVGALRQHHQGKFLGSSGFAQGQGSRQGDAGICRRTGHLGRAVHNGQHIVVSGAPGDCGSADGRGQGKIGGDISRAQGQLLLIIGEIAAVIAGRNLDGDGLRLPRLTQGDVGRQFNGRFRTGAGDRTVVGDDRRVIRFPCNGRVAAAARRGKLQIVNDAFRQRQSFRIRVHKGLRRDRIGQVFSQHFRPGERLVVDLQVIQVEVAGVPVMGAGCAKIEKLLLGHEV